MMSSSIPVDTTTAAVVVPTESHPAGPLRMQIILRRDLFENLGWPVGPLMAQASHASTAVLHQFKDEPNVQTYLEDLPNMRKLVYQTTDMNTLQKTIDHLETTGSKYFLWMEQPENYPTALAIVPNRKDNKAVSKALHKGGCVLWK
ncbi:Uncharacterized conserved protein [Phaffia rhodozyma]|uniref:peptidyl-tRNA hydrolase n=1 Tax=Phaffia rhodozyma TaxID=264483 RepID=A0A0F7SIQ4_PHARH|nr:Uncharacterized conserved protein [Phaffia rhodozyma]